MNCPDSGLLCSFKLKPMILKPVSAVAAFVQLAAAFFWGYMTQKL
jgi:hypothetical protein